MISRTDESSVAGGT